MFPYIFSQYSMMYHIISLIRRRICMPKISIILNDYIFIDQIRHYPSVIDFYTILRF